MRQDLQKRRYNIGEVDISLKIVIPAKTNIRILSIIPYRVFPAIMGGQKGIALFYKYLSRIVSLTVLTIQKNEATEGYEIINSISDSKWRYLNPFLFFTIKKMVRQKDITHILFEHPYYAWLIFIFKKCSSKEIIVHSHNIESERFKSIGKWWWKVLWYYERWAYRNAHFIWFKTNEDMQYAIIHYGIKSQGCHVIPYGIEPDSLPSAYELSNAKNVLQDLHSIPDQEKIILFNGTLSYKPNLDALISILDKINPLLLKSSLKYKILICGKGLPAEMKGLQDYLDKNIIYCGFVEDIDLYFKGCDIFLNPLQDGGGIKTKLVEALGFGKACVSSGNGAIGIDTEDTGGRLKIVPDKDWQSYSEAICNSQTSFQNDNSSFYKVFSWKNIAIKAQTILEKRE